MIPQQAPLPDSLTIRCLGCVGTTEEILGQRPCYLTEDQHPQLRTSICFRHRQPRSSWTQSACSQASSRRLLACAIRVLGPQAMKSFQFDVTRREILLLPNGGHGSRTPVTNRLMWGEWEFTALCYDGTQESNGFESIRACMEEGGRRGRRGRGEGSKVEALEAPGDVDILLGISEACRCGCQTSRRHARATTRALNKGYDVLSDR